MVAWERAFGSWTLKWYVPWTSEYSFNFSSQFCDVESWERCSRVSQAGNYSTELRDSPAGLDSCWSGFTLLSPCQEFFLSGDCWGWGI